jgi:hypothetical protein
MATKTKRFEIRAEDSFIKTIERLAKESGTSKAAVIDAAVNLLAQKLDSMHNIQAPPPWTSDNIMSDQKEQDEHRGIIRSSRV